MGPEPEMTSKTNPILASILQRYVGADSVNGSPLPKSDKPSSNTDWYNMTCPRCPWFVDGAKTGEYSVITNNVADDVASGMPDAPDYTQMAEKDADGDSGRLNSDDMPGDAAMNESLRILNSDSNKNADIIGPKQSNERRQVSTVRCVRPESVECLNDSICVQLIVASDLIRQQAAMIRMRDKHLSEIAPFIVGTDENRKRTMNNVKKNVRSRSTLKRNRKLIKAAKKRGR